MHVVDVCILVEIKESAGAVEEIESCECGWMRKIFRPTKPIRYGSPNITGVEVGVRLEIKGVGLLIAYTYAG
jgi:hypothetical protein